MTTLTNLFSRIMLVASICVFAAASSINAQEIITNTRSEHSGDTARLIVNRSANFGINESINLFVDGIQIAVLGYNQSYDAPLTPGKHTLYISTAPETYPEGTPKRLAVTAKSGKTYTFTAVWRDDERAGLVPN
jgi:hypothetical protein